MSTTIKSLAGAGCGCNTPQTVQPDELAVVPAGSLVVQAPCADACVPASSSNISAIQQPGSAPSCASYANPCVSSTFQVAAIGKSGTFNATCASSWALPGLRLYFPGLGVLAVTGVSSGEVITYENLTMEAGTQVNQGICFHHDAPQIVVASESGGESVEEEVWADSATLDHVYGDEGNTKKKIVPVDGMILYGEGGKWIRRQAGQMRYPVAPSPQILSYNSTAKNKSWNLALPNLPTIPGASIAFAVGLDLRLKVYTTTSGDGPEMQIKDKDGQELVAAYGYPSKAIDHSHVILPLAKTDTAVDLSATKVGSASGTFVLQVTLEAYYY